MTVGYSKEIRNARLQLIANAIDSGASGGKLIFYPGTRPEEVGGLPADLPILGMTFEKPSAGVIMNGQLNLKLKTPATVERSGGPAWARITNSEGLTLFDLDVGLAGSGADLIISAARWYEGGEVTTDSILLVI